MNAALARGGSGSRSGFSATRRIRAGLKSDLHP